MKKLLACFAVLFLLFAVSTPAAITHGTNMRGGLSQAILDSCGSGAIVVLLQTATPLDTVTLQNPAFSRTGATLTLLGVPLSSTAAASGTINTFKVVNSGGTTIFTGTVTITGGGGDMTVDNTSVNAAQTVNITSMTYTSAP